MYGPGVAHRENRQTSPSRGRFGSPVRYGYERCTPEGCGSPVFSSPVKQQQQQRNVSTGAWVKLGDRGRLNGVLRQGEIGVVTHIDGGHMAPFKVKGPGGAEGWYASNELELVKQDAGKALSSFDVPASTPPPMVTYSLHVHPGEGIGLSCKNITGKVIVASVVPDTPAFRAGMTPGCVVSRMGHIPIRTVQDIKEAVDLFRTSRSNVLTVEVDRGANGARHPSYEDLVMERIPIISSVRQVQAYSPSPRRGYSSPRTPAYYSPPLVNPPSLVGKQSSIPGSRPPSVVPSSPSESRPATVAGSPSGVGSQSPTSIVKPPSAVGSHRPSATGSAGKPPSAVGSQAPTAVGPAASKPPSAVGSQAPTAVGPAASKPPSAVGSQAPTAVGLAVSKPPSAVGSQAPTAVGSKPPSAVGSNKPASSAASKPGSSVPDLQNVNVEEHNKLRQQHGAPPVAYDSGLAKHAQAQADSCLASNTLSHGNNPNEGQNCFFSGFSSPPAHDALVAQAAKAWYDEISDYKKAGGGLAGLNAGAGHFTQLVWKGSTKVGLGIAVSGSSAYVVVNYGPPGNMAVDGDIRSNVQA